MLYNRKQISIYTRYECLYTTVMVTLNIYIGLHYLVALFNQIKNALLEIEIQQICLYFVYYNCIIGLQKLYEV